MLGGGGVGQGDGEGGGGGLGSVLTHAGDDPEADFIGGVAGGEDEGVDVAFVLRDAGGVAGVVVAQGEDAGVGGVGGAQAQGNGPRLGVF